MPDSLRQAAVPGAAIAQAYGGRGLAVVVGLLTAGGTLALVVAEYLALGGCCTGCTASRSRTSYAWIAVPFLAPDALSLVDPDRFYDDLLKPSLGALFVSQLAVFVVFPRFRRGPLALGAAAVASGLAVWGLYTLVAAPPRRSRRSRHIRAVPATVSSARSGATKARARSSTCSRSSRIVVCRYQGGPNTGHTIVRRRRDVQDPADPDGRASPGSRA